MLLQAGAYLRMGCQVAVESRMGGEKLRIIRQPWIAVELLGYLRMAVQVAVIESGNRPSVRKATSVLIAVTVPRVGGETGWADMRAAYDALDDTMLVRVERLAAHHSLRYSQAKIGHIPNEGSDYSGYGFHNGPVPLRQLVKVHPETGRKSLVIGRHAYGIPGMNADDSEQLLQELVNFACRPPRVYHHTWTPGEAVVWDNRCLMHRAMPWDTREPRVMWHSRIAGDPISEGTLPPA